ncbi:GTP-binding protein 2 [Lepeophtheirus salmonis]|uniref:GTP-binding protein 2 n=1 Tax=Lepeophtheirus salmonis TaxID=72036 RepID=A0A7R8H4Z8_LEPSM|nr:GTP-binding protein 2 [Lepeophtheirus salmonis]CAF2853450.1 GTP-binding protein 2 [Lepeophtheirus salmonis]
MEALSCLDLFGPCEEKAPKSRMTPRSHTSIDLQHYHQGRLPLSLSEGDFSSLPPEPQEGNIEYKLKLLNPSSDRLKHLITQMKWRLREGEGEAIYEMGVEDNGIMTGLSKKDMEGSLDTLRLMATNLNANIQILRTRTLDNGHSVCEILVRKVPDDRQCT